MQCILVSTCTLSNGTGLPLHIEQRQILAKQRTYYMHEIVPSTPNKFETDMQYLEPVRYAKTKFLSGFLLVSIRAAEGAAERGCALLPGGLGDAGGVTGGVDACDTWVVGGAVGLGGDDAPET